VTDTLKVGSHEFQLVQFPFTTRYASNMTIEGQICYAKSVKEFAFNCEKSGIDGDAWIIVTPFDFSETNDILKSVDDYNIGAVIIQHDGKIDARGLYAEPKVIALVKDPAGTLL